jgi:hypothetical protein
VTLIHTRSLRSIGDDKCVEQVEANGRDYEEVHRGDFWDVIMKKSPPSLAVCLSEFKLARTDDEVRREMA